jgi:hypothetical protein
MRKAMEAAEIVSHLLQPGAQRFGLVDAHRALRAALNAAKGGE